LTVTKIGGKVAHRPWKKPLDFGSNLHHITLGSAAYPGAEGS